jgi:hypothetical protein
MNLVVENQCCKKQKHPRASGMRAKIIELGFEKKS